MSYIHIQYAYVYTWHMCIYDWRIYICVTCIYICIKQSYIHMLYVDAICMYMSQLTYGCAFAQVWCGVWHGLLIFWPRHGPRKLGRCAAGTGQIRRETSSKNEQTGQKWLSHVKCNCVKCHNTQTLWGNIDRRGANRWHVTESWAHCRTLLRSATHCYTLQH